MAPIITLLALFIGSAAAFSQSIDTYRALASFAANELATAARSEILPYWRQLPDDNVETKYDDT